MRYILVDVSPTVRRIIAVDYQYQFNKILLSLKQRYHCREVPQPPSKRTLNRWRLQGKCKAICGCWVESNRGSRCPQHNAMSWLTAVYNLKE